MRFDGGRTRKGCNAAGSGQTGGREAVSVFVILELSLAQLGGSPVTGKVAMVFQEEGTVYIHEGPEARGAWLVQVWH